MRKETAQQLSRGEMEMMNLLWTHGPLTLSEAHAAMGKAIGYTTVQTRLNRLVEKGIVDRSAERPAQYSAAISSDSVSEGLLDQLVDKVAQGSVVPLVGHLLANRTLSADEIAELKRFISDAEQSMAD